MKTNILLGCIVIVTSSFVACSGNGIDITPDTSSTGSSSLSETVSSSSSSGNGGAGGGNIGAGGSGGASCDPCKNENGLRIFAKIKTTTTPDGLHWENQVGWQDHDLKMNCKPLYAEDKQVRCLPADAIMIATADADPVNYRYADAGCTSRFIEGSIAPCISPYLYALEPYGAQLQCLGQPYQVYSLGPGVQSLQVYKKSGAQCVQTTNFMTGYYVDKTLPATTFAAMTETVSP